MDPEIEVSYKNWRGEIRTRMISPTGELAFKATEFHPIPQWILEAVDPEDGKRKDFALKDCNFRRT